MGEREAGSFRSANKKRGKLVEMPATRKNMRKSGKKNSQAGGKKTRKLSPALTAWTEKVMKKYREMKKKNPATKLGDAMKAAKKDQ